MQFLKFIIATNLLLNSRLSKILFVYFYPAQNMTKRIFWVQKYGPEKSEPSVFVFSYSSFIPLTSPFLIPLHSREADLQLTCKTKN
jgi:hypothetical protein